MSFLYYFPGQSQSAAADQLIQRFDLDDRIRKADVGFVHANGPDGGSGVVLVDSSYNISPRVDLNQQTWRAAPKRREDVSPYWVGYWNSRRPDEANLRRAKTLAGQSIELRDGAKWLVPRLIEFIPPVDVSQQIQFNVPLPKVLDIDDDGVEIVMLVPILAIVMRGAGGKVIFGAGIQAKDQARVDHAFGHL